MDTLPALQGYTDKQVTITPLRGRSTRVDVEVRDTQPVPTSFVTTNVVAQLRKFFDALDAEADLRKHDPVAMVTALANMEALLADVRYVRDTVRDHAAAGLNDNGIRRMVIEGVANAEGTSSMDRKWHDERLLTETLHKLVPGGIIDAGTGEQRPPDVLAAELLQWFAVSYWRMGALREHGLDPDKYSDYTSDDDGKPVRTPTVRMHDNRIRRSRA